MSARSSGTGSPTEHSDWDSHGAAMKDGEVRSKDTYCSLLLLFRMKHLSSCIGSKAPRRKQEMKEMQGQYQVVNVIFYDTEKQHGFHHW